MSCDGWRQVGEQSFGAQFILDVRNRNDWLAGPRFQRSIGAVYNDAAPGSYGTMARDTQLFVVCTGPPRSRSGCRTRSPAAYCGS